MPCSLAKLTQYRTEQPLRLQSKRWASLPSLAVMATDLHTSERKCPLPFLANCFLNSGLKQLKDYVAFERNDDFIQSCYIHLTLQYTLILTYFPRGVCVGGCGGCVCVGVGVLLKFSPFESFENHFNTFIFYV